ncbi:MAG: hypothetical protein J7603_04260 [Pseudacidovorax sp.]|nr:hypothetical protein [Pseudacidovorax sp.]
MAIDPTSIKPHNEYVEPWTRTLYNELQMDNSNPLKPISYKWTKYLYDFDCKGQRLLLRQFMRYTGPLEVQEVKIPSSAAKWQAADNPSYVGGMLLRVVCKTP